MNKIVWVFGESAAGKETFIRYASSNPDIEKQIILLSVESNDLYSRLPDKYWWKDVNYSQEQMEENVAKMRNHIANLLELGFTVTEINATNGYELLQNNSLTKKRTI